MVIVTCYTFVSLARESLPTKKVRIVIISVAISLLAFLYIYSIQVYYYRTSDKTTIKGQPNYFKMTTENVARISFFGGFP